MSLEKALVVELKDNVGVGSRIYPLTAPQSIGRQSCIVYTRVSTRRYPCLQVDADYQTPRIQLDCYATEYGDARDIAEKVIERLQNKLGTLGSGTSTVDGAAILIEAEQAMYDQEARQYRVSIDVMITHKE